MGQGASVIGGVETESNGVRFRMSHVEMDSSLYGLLSSAPKSLDPFLLAAPGVHLKDGEDSPVPYVHGELPTALGEAGKDYILLLLDLATQTVGIG